LWLPYWMWFLDIDKFYVGAQAFIYDVFITHATSLASASASLFLGLVNIPARYTTTSVCPLFMAHSCVISWVTDTTRRRTDGHVTAAVTRQGWVTNERWCSLVMWDVRDNSGSSSRVLTNDTPYRNWGNFSFYSEILIKFYDTESG